ncbi:hypothetical protein CRYUN_Cryun07bG0025800 [Craigia yunnanensis]
MEEEAKGRREVESRVIEKVGEVIREIERAKHAEQVICALHSLAVLLFPIDSSLLSGHSSSINGLRINLLIVIQEKINGLRMKAPKPHALLILELNQGAQRFWLVEINNRRKLEHTYDSHIGAPTMELVEFEKEQRKKFEKEMIREKFCSIVHSFGRRPQPKVSAQAKEKTPKKKNDDEDDNWELPEGDLP